MAPRRDPTRLRCALAVAPVTAACLLGTFVAAYSVQNRSEALGERAFAQQSEVVAESIESQIERHVEAVEDTAAFADATWPGNIQAWRKYITERVTADTYLAFSSSAGLIERVPAAEIAAFEAREAESSGLPFSITAAPDRTNEDLHVLTRTAVDETLSGIPIRGLDTTRAIKEFGLELPTTEHTLEMVSLADAPEIVDSVLGITAPDIDDVPIAGTDVVFVHTVGDADSPPKGWVIVPAQLGFLLDSVAADTNGGVNATVAVPEMEVEGDLGRYEGVPGLDLGAAGHVAHRDYDIGGWTWEIDIWAAEGYGVRDTTIGQSEVLLAGLLVTIALSALLYGRRRHRLRLGLAEFELSLQRTLSETDSLTGLLNRQGLSAGFDELPHAAGSTVLFLDIDQFKAINDGQGHAAGDRTLVSVADAVRSVAREADLIARLGGDEFIVVCPGVGDMESARVIARRFTEAVSGIADARPLAVSIGVALGRPGESFDLETLIHTADKSMYEAKRAGGAQTLIAGSLDEYGTQPA